MNVRAFHRVDLRGRIYFDLFNPRYHCLGFHSMKVDYDMSACDGEDLILH